MGVRGKRFIPSSRCTAGYGEDKASSVVEEKDGNPSKGRCRFLLQTRRTAGCSEVSARRDPPPDLTARVC